jgi:hypothetical protein
MISRLPEYPSIPDLSVTAETSSPAVTSSTSFAETPGGKSGIRFRPIDDSPQATRDRFRVCASELDGFKNQRPNNPMYKREIFVSILAKFTFNDT